MQAFRFRLELQGPYGTPLTSGTLAGQLCWAAAEAGSLERVLAAQRSGRLLVSDVLPEDMLPRPLLAPAPAAGSPDLARLENAKREKQLSWVRRDAFLAARGRIDHATIGAALARAAAGDAKVRIAHNSIDRLRGTTPDEGGLFFLDEWWPADNARHRDLYLVTDLPRAEVEALVAAVGAWGFGRDASTGRGRFRVANVAADSALLSHGGNRLLSLSSGCHGPGMAAPRWKLWTHYGKVGAELVARGGRPWKRPVLLFRPGCTFRPDGPGPFGGWLDTIYQDAAKVGFAPGLNAWHLAVPYTEVGG